ncbi:hypothetical protein HZC34_04715 [Candidatus Saganbacteria bacterium]|nr:hypothetical protein [Candidatus Saganbacteria bacterium]
MKKLILAIIILLFSSMAFAAPSITIFSPKSGDNIGGSINITWLASDSVGFSLTPISIYYSVDGGATYTKITNATENDGQSWWGSWGISDTAAAKIKIEAKNLNNEIATAESNVFSIYSSPYTNLAVSIPYILIGGTTQEISWNSYDAGSDLLENSVSIYFRENSNTDWVLLASNQALSGKYIFSVPLINSSNAAIRFDVKDKAGHAGSDSWGFSITTKPPSIAVSAPNGGEKIDGGKQYTLKWTVANSESLPAYPFSLFYSLDNGSSYTKIAEGIQRGATSYNWAAPLINNALAKIKITAADVFGKVYSDESDNAFTLYMPPAGTILSPNGGENLKGGDVANITWIASGEGINPSDCKVNLKYSTNGGSAWQDIASGLDNSGLYGWTLPKIDSNKTKIKVEVINSKSEVVSSDQSDNDFTIDSTPPTVTILKPTATYIWTLNNSYGYGGGKFGSDLTISYNANDNFGFSSADLYFSNDGGNLYKWIGASQKINENSSFWIEEPNDTEIAKIKVQVKDKAGNIATLESAAFKVASVPLVSIISPSWNEYIKGGTSYKIKWQASDLKNNLLSNPITIKYSSNNGTSWQTIASNEVNDGEYDWTAPSIDVNQYNGKLRIEALDSDGNVGFQEVYAGIDSTAPTVKFTNLPAEDMIKTDGQINLTWNIVEKGSVKGAELYYSTDSGASYSKVEQTINYWNNGGSCTWDVPQALNGKNVKFKVEVVDYVNNAATDESKSYKIMFIPKVSIVYPIPYSFAGGSTYNIKWKASATASNLAQNPITIKFSSDNGASWETIAANQPNTSEYIWKVPSIDAKYCKIRIEAVDVDGTIGSSDMGFRIDSTAPDIILTSLNSGETINSGQNYNITWKWTDKNSGQNGSTLNCIISYSTNEGAAYSKIGDSSAYFYGWDGYKDGNFVWTVPDNISTSSAKVKLEAIDNAGNISTAESAKPFSIMIPPVGTVLSPNGGENYYYLDTVGIKWKKDGGEAVANDYLVDLYYKKNGGSDWKTIAQAIKNTGAYSIPVSVIVADSKTYINEAKIKVEMVKNGTISSSDESDDVFVVYSGTSSNVNNAILIKAPSTGEVLTAGSTYKIAWETNDNLYLSKKDKISIYVYYFSDHDEYPYNKNVSGVDFIAKDQPGDQNYFNWKIPTNTKAAKFARIYVNTSGKQYANGYSAEFSIDSPFTDKNLYFDASGEAKIEFPNGVESGLKWAKFEETPSPKTAPRGAKIVKAPFKISGDVDDLKAEGQFSLPFASEIKNPKVFWFSPKENKWQKVAAVKLGDKMLFKFRKLGVFAVFDVIDNNPPEIFSIKVNGRKVAKDDSIPSSPDIQIDVKDDYGIDIGVMSLSIDNEEAKSLQLDGISAKSDAFPVQAGTFRTKGALSADLPVGPHTFTIVASDEVGNSTTFIETLYVVGSSVSGLMVYPNPYHIGQTLKFDGLASDVNVYIYEISGDLVWHGFTSGAASISWDGKNNFGNAAVPGVYLYLVKDSQGSRSIGKIAVIK